MRHRAALGPHIVDRMLDNVERRRFQVNPTRKHPAELLVRAFDIELQERARQLLGLPRRGRFARRHPHDRITDAQRIAGLHLQIGGDAVALVEQSDHGGTFGHRRRSLGAYFGRGDRARSATDADGRRARDALCIAVGRRRIASARGEQQKSGRNRIFARHAAGSDSGAGASGAAVSGGGGPRPVPLIIPTISPIMSTAPCVSRMTSPSFIVSVAPPGTSWI